MIRALFVVLALAAPTFQLNLLPYAPKVHARQQYLPMGWAGSVNATQRAKRASTTENQQCGKVVQSVPVALTDDGASVLEGQWPWHVALYHIEEADSNYICGGTLVSPRHVITAAARCVIKKGSTVDQRTLTVFLGKENLKTSYDGVQIRLVEKITVHPDFDKSTYSRNVAILELRKPVSFTAWVQPVCLWPDYQEDLSTIIGKKGSVVGWGFDETDKVPAELRLVEMPVVDTVTCIRSYSAFFDRFTSEYTYCAGSRNGVLVCDGYTGGGMVFKSGDTWYLRGLVSFTVLKRGELVCDPSHYVIFADIAKVLPWIKGNVGNL